MSGGPGVLSSKILIIRLALSFLTCLKIREAPVCSFIPLLVLGSWMLFIGGSCAYMLVLVPVEMLCSFVYMEIVRPGCLTLLSGC